MESDLQHLSQVHPHQLEPMGSGLVRYQSAPSSFFSSFIENDDFFPRRPLSPETERIIARFMNSANDTAPPKTTSPPPIKTEAIVHHHQSNFYQSCSQPPRPPAPINYRVVNTAGMKMEPPNNSNNLVRQHSSPAGLFSNINIHNELASYAAMRGMGNAGAGYGCSNNEPSFSSRSGMVPPPSVLGAISATEVKPVVGGDEDYATGFPIGSWDDPALMSNKLGGLKRVRDDEGTKTQLQSGEVGSRRPPILAHHLSLQKTSAEMAAIENFFQFQDSVSCKIRAKRGCATHPRSIAERVRRTKISERMRKLQELVPNMDKQTNTSDMLDLAVDYIKELQKEVQKLSDNRSKCKCPHKQHHS